ncbi:hypothetical protein RchiOBHm_Chr1g0381301 [Rosa chinensis]|uniref:Uncharacterized protein n=1 Tax=Rosa chinensis TaxID=74649 RepID=A0A2P6SP35_ROSCH|nr:hypothetical protein RchiOBHm_Chr1g0381301 [Rosa chinensis]
MHTTCLMKVPVVALRDIYKTLNQLPQLRHWSMIMSLLWRLRNSPLDHSLHDLSSRNVVTILIFAKLVSCDICGSDGSNFFFFKSNLVLFIIETGWWQTYSGRTSAYP